MKKLTILCAAAALVVSASAARADYVPVDLSNYVNEGFTNSWFANGSDFTSIVETTNGNQGSPVPFTVANVSDGNGGAPTTSGSASIAAPARSSARPAPSPFR